MLVPPPTPEGWSPPCPVSPRVCVFEPAPSFSLTAPLAHPPPRSGALVLCMVSSGCVSTSPLTLSPVSSSLDLSLFLSLVFSDTRSLSLSTCLSLFPSLTLRPCPPFPLILCLSSHLYISLSLSVPLSLLVGSGGSEVSALRALAEQAGWGSDLCCFAVTLDKSLPLSCLLRFPFCQRKVMLRPLFHLTSLKRAVHGDRGWRCLSHCWSLMPGIERVLNQPLRKDL